jgi:hypothetical protein
LTWGEGCGTVGGMDPTEYQQRQVNDLLNFMTDAAMNRFLSEELYRHASRPLPWAIVEWTPLSRWKRFKFWLDRWMPRVHLGPCNHDGCE